MLNKPQIATEPIADVIPKNVGLPLGAVADAAQETLSSEVG